MAPRPRGNVKLSTLRAEGGKASGVRVSKAGAAARSAGTPRIRLQTPLQPAGQNRKKPRPEPKPELRVRVSLGLSRIGLDARGRERAQGIVLHVVLAVTAVAARAGAGLASPVARGTSAMRNTARRDALEARTTSEVRRGSNETLLIITGSMLKGCRVLAAGVSAGGSGARCFVR